jgi:hypothetical protein
MSLQRARLRMMSGRSCSAVNLRKVKGPDRTRLRSYSVWTPDIVLFLRALISPGVTPPVGCLSVFHLLMQGGLIGNACDRTNGLSSIRTRQSTFAKVFRIGTRRPC